MNGLTLAFYPHDEEERVHVMHALTAKFQEVQTTFRYPGDMRHKQILIRIKHLLTEGEPSIQEQVHKEFPHLWCVYCPGDLCDHPDCYNPTNTTAAGILFPMHDRHGEELDPVLTTCAHHADAKSLLALRLLEVQDVYGTYSDSQWQKIGVWSYSTKREKWYSQVVGQEQEGDYEMGYHACLYSSPRLGPFATKEAALEAAKEYQC